MYRKEYANTLSFCYVSIFCYSYIHLFIHLFYTYTNSLPAVYQSVGYVSPSFIASLGIVDEGRVDRGWTPSFHGLSHVFHVIEKDTHLKKIKAVVILAAAVVVIMMMIMVIIITKIIN